MKKHLNHKAPGLLFVFSILLIGILAISTIFLSKKKNVDISQGEKIMIPVSPSPVTHYQWKKYTNGMVLHNAFSLNVPNEWKINYEDKGQLSKDDVGYRYNLDMLPPGEKDYSQENGWFGWGGINIDIYPPEPNASSWIHDNLAQFEDVLQYTPDSKIGGITSYLISSRKETGFTSRKLVLGREHSYIVEYDSGGSVESGDIIDKTVLPSFSLK